MNDHVPSETDAIRNSRLIATAMMGGIVAFVAVIVFMLLQTPANPEPADAPSLPLLGAVTFGLWIGGRLLSSVLLTKLNPQLAADHPQRAYITRSVLRMALHEGPALAGLVFLLILGLDYGPALPPVAWALTLPAVLMILEVLFAPPSEEDFRDRVRQARETTSRR